MTEQEYLQGVTSIWLTLASHLAANPQLRGTESYEKVRRSTIELLEHAYGMRSRAINADLDRAAVVLAEALDLPHLAEPLFDPLNIKRLVADRSDKNG